MPESEFTVRPRIELDGSELSAELHQLVERVVVDHRLHLPDMFSLVFRDIARDVLSRARVKIGTKVKISAGPLGGRQPEPLISGEVTALEGEYDGAGSRVVVRGYDESHRLQIGRQTQTYRNVKDTDIARTVAGRAQLGTGTVDDSGTTHEHVSQANLTDWDFLKARAREIGFEVSVSDGKLHFRKPPESGRAPADGDYNSTNPLQLVFGQDLLEFRPRLSSAQQVKEVSVRGWDPSQKQAVVGSAQAGTTSATLPQTPSALAQKFGGKTYVAVDRPLSTQSEVDAAARAIAEQIGSAHAEAEGVARGNPRLRAGVAVSVGVVAQDFVGRYTLTHTRHVFDALGYRTLFEVSGRQERSLMGIVSLGGTNGTASAGGPPIYGVVIGQVTNVKDPEDLGRVKLKFPWLSDSYESDWARMTQFGAGKGNGSLFLPEVNDEVLVAFEFGDVRRPYVVGCLYNGVDKPDGAGQAVDSASGSVKRHYFHSRKKHELCFSDEDGKESIVVQTTDGKTAITLDHSKTTVTIHSDGKVEITAKSDVKIDAQGSCSVTAKSGLKLESSGGSVEVKGMGVKIDGGAGQVEVSGSAIKLN